jgi:KorB domain
MRTAGHYKVRDPPPEPSDEDLEIYEAFFSHGFKRKVIAERLGRSESWVSGHIAIACAERAIRAKRPLEAEDIRKARARRRAQAYVEALRKFGGEV